MQKDHHQRLPARMSPPHVAVQSSSSEQRKVPSPWINTGTRKILVRVTGLAPKILAGRPRRAAANRRPRVRRASVKSSSSHPLGLRIVGRCVHETHVLDGAETQGGRGARRDVIMLVHDGTASARYRHYPAAAFSSLWTSCGRGAPEEGESQEMRLRKGQRRRRRCGRLYGRPLSGGCVHMRVSGSHPLVLGPSAVVSDQAKRESNAVRGEATLVPCRDKKRDPDLKSQKLELSCMSLGFSILMVT
ncbi:hypothetical protein GGR53DRAFT_532058 [Hypoxylon sp. FL1150]|nr:hypothetical protein GGR53DRAFT_532058 [Hypoxylon sp. FL1150]